MEQHRETNIEGLSTQKLAKNSIEVLSSVQGQTDFKIQEQIDTSTSSCAPIPLISGEGRNVSSISPEKFKTNNQVEQNSQMALEMEKDDDQLMDEEKKEDLFQLQAEEKMQDGTEGNEDKPQFIQFAPVILKRGRGRPRKVPLPIQPTQIVSQTVASDGSIINVVSEVQPDEETLKRLREAEQRRKYKEELKKKSQEMVSDCSDTEEDQIDEKLFTPNSAFLKQYRQRLIGRSSNSKIFELKDPHTDQNIGEVIKLVPHKMSNHHQTECRELRNEYRFLKKMDHHRVICLGSNKEFIRDRNYCGIILPQAECNLMHFAKSQRHAKISLEQIRLALRQIAEAISYLHDNFISHNDIKPDNMFKFSDTDFKLADFGFSIDLPKPNSYKRNSTFSQTLRKQVKIEDLKKNWKLRCKQYVAPELIKLLGGKRPRTASDEKSCDVFALGVSFFIIIFYQLPFCGAALKTDQRYKFFFNGTVEKFWQQFKSMFEKFDQQPNSYTSELKDLFNKMLDPSPTNRLTIEGVLEHPWLNH